VIVGEFPFPTLDLSALDDHPATLAAFHWLRFREPWNGDHAVKLLGWEFPAIDPGFAQAAAQRYCRENNKPEHGRIPGPRSEESDRFTDDWPPRRGGT